MNTVTLFYFHDPMCSWCWGFSTALSNLRQGLGTDIVFKRILGGLAPDNSKPMPLDLREQIQNGWRRIESLVPGVKFNFDFWTQCEPKRATYASCRAVIAARRQGKHYDEIMTKAIQLAYYRQARNPSLDSTLIEIAGELGLDQEHFSEDLASASVDSILRDEIEFSRSLDIDSFPSLVLMINEEAIPIGLDYLNADTMLAIINKHRKNHGA